MRKRHYGRIRNPRQIILVICEGESEAAYVDLLRKHYRLPITIKSKILGNKINKRLVKQILSQESLTGNEDSRVIYMYDSDVESIIEKLKQLDGTLIISNPCIELWYLLHHQDHSRFSSSKEIVKRLENSLSLWNGYTKGKLTDGQKEFLLNNSEGAVNRAKSLNSFINPSTNMYKFLEILDSEKNA